MPHPIFTNIIYTNSAAIDPEIIRTMGEFMKYNIMAGDIYPMI